MGWCDICEKNIKGRSYKISGFGYSTYLCGKHHKVMTRRHPTTKKRIVKTKKTKAKRAGRR